MMMKKWMRVVSPILLIAMFYSGVSQGEDLLQVYQQALQNDPKFKQDYAQWRSRKMNLPIARSAYLPQLSAQASASRNFTGLFPKAISPIHGYYWMYGYSATLQQPLFAASTWEAIKQADAQVKSATATFLAAQQDLMLRTAQAYFEVLKRCNTLKYIVARKNAIYKQWESAKATYHAGLIAITDVYDAESRYDVARTQEITAKNNLKIALEQLRAITGHYYKNLYGLKGNIPLRVPSPQDLDAWTRSAEKDNYFIQAEKYSVLAGMKNIRRVSAQDLPVITFSTGFSELQNFAQNSNRTTNDTTTMGLNLNYPIIQGGLVRTSLRQARYDYVAAAGKLDEVHNQIVATTRSSFMSIEAGVDAVKADRVSVESAQKALDATSEGLKVGTRTMLDVLLDLTNLYTNKQQFVDDQYTYLTSIVQLKNASSRLSLADLARINKNLKNNIVLPS